MKLRPMFGAALSMSVFAAPSMAALSAQPPMNDFNQAFYICQNNTAFMVTYDSDTPQTATLTISANNKTYTLTRLPAATGAQFSVGAIKLSTDGKAAQLEGTAAHFQNCRIKGG